MNRWLTSANETTGYIVYEFNVPTVVDSIGVMMPNATGLQVDMRAPKAWTFEGSNDNSDWTVLDDTQTGETGWTEGESRYYKFANTKAYKYYKFNCTANNGATQMQIGELEFYCTGTGNVVWTGGGETGLVNDDANWGGSMPGSEYEAQINDTGATPATIPAGLTVYKYLYLANGSGKSAKVVQTTGTVKLPTDITIGRSGGTAEYAISGGKLDIASKLHMSAKSGKSSSILDISGDGEVATGSDLYMNTDSASAGSTAGINISENGKLSVGNELRIGAVTGSATGMVYQAGGTVSAKNINLGVGQSNYSEYKMSGGICTATGTDIVIGYSQNSEGLFEMTGGTLSVPGTSTQAGKLSVGRFGYGTFAAGGVGTVVTAPLVRVGFTYSNDANKGYGTFIVTNGAEVATKNVFAGAGASYVDRAKVVFDGAVLTATAASTSGNEFLKDLQDITLGAGGLTINTKGYNVTISNCAFNVTPGAKITVTGGGTVTFSGTTVNLAERPDKPFTFAETDGAFSGAPVLSGGKATIVATANSIRIVPSGLMIIVR